MRKLLTALAILALVVLTPSAQELIQLGTPETKPANTAYHIATLTLDVDAGLLHVVFKGVTDEIVTCAYSATTNPTGAFLITALNKANLSSAYAANATTGSLKQRIHHRLVVMNESAAVCSKPLVGTLTGAVQ